MSTQAQPRIVVTLTNPQHSADPARTRRNVARYLTAVDARGATAVPLDDRATGRERQTAFEAMDGLLISGGADIDPARYGEAANGSRAPDRNRDTLDEEAYTVARRRRVPVLGVCRGLQVINVFEGGELIQHVDDHESSAGAVGADVRRHVLRILPDTRLEAILGGRSALEVNSFHHQAVSPAGLAPGLRAAGVTPHATGDLVEALEAIDPDLWLVALQCHPERLDTTPTVLGGLWDAFVEVAGKPA